jgi:hypothetical protein
MQQLKKLFASPDGWWATLQSGGLMYYDAQRGARTGAFSGASGARPQAHTIAGGNARSTRAVSRRRALDL